MENRVLGMAVKAAIAGSAVVPVQQRQEAPPPEPEQPSPFAHDGHGNRAARRKETRGGWGNRSSKVLPSQAKQKKRRKLEAAGRKAARKGKR
jgi:hypothetical protein